jgi:hypothetical protein
VTRGLALADGEAAHTACARALIRAGIDEKTGEFLSAASIADRVVWCAALVKGMAARLVAEHWNASDVRGLAAGQDAQGRPLPSQGWMALCRLGWGASPADGVTANDRITRMAQEQAGRILRSACWRDDLIRAVTATWPAEPAKRTREEWDEVRAAVPGGEHLPSTVIRARTRQIARFLKGHGCLPNGVTGLEPPPGVPGTLILAACDRQQAVLEPARGRPWPGAAAAPTPGPPRPEVLPRLDLGGGPLGPAADRPRERDAAPAYPARRGRPGLC